MRHATRITCAAILSASLSTAACGGRSDLRVAAGGSGGDASSAASSSAGTGAHGPCASLTITGAPLAFSDVAGVAQRGPGLAPATDDGSVVGVIFARSPDQPIAALAGMQTLFPWASWPASLPPFQNGSFSSNVGGLAVGRGSAPETLALVNANSPAPPGPEPSSLLFMPDLSTSSGTWSTSAISIGDGSAGQFVRFVIRSQDAHVVGYQNGAPGKRGIALVHVSAAGDVVSSPTLGCANGALFADAVPSTDPASAEGVLFAFSSAAPWAGCGGAIPAGPPGNIFLGHLGGPGGYAPLVWSFEEADAVRSLNLAAHDGGGAWVVFQYEGLNAEVQPPAMAVLVDAAGQLLLGPFPVTDGPQLVGRAAVGHLGDLLVVAFAASGAGDVEVRLFDTGGALVAKALVSSPAGGTPNGEIAVFTDPGTRSILVAWSQAPAAAPHDTRVHLARLGCAP
jgi:hypothetical protein